MLNNLGNTIKSYRKLKGYSTQTLSHKLEISVGLLNNIENGRTDAFQLNLLNKIIYELDIPFDELKILDFSTKVPSIQFIDNSINIKIEDCAELDDLNCKYLSALIKSYLDTIHSSSFDKSKLPLINDHLINELKFLKALSDKPAK